MTNRNLIQNWTAVPVYNLVKTSVHGPVHALVCNSVELAVMNLVGWGGIYRSVQDPIWHLDKNLIKELNGDH